MYAMASHGLSSNKDVRKFYKSQGTRYDGFREALLPHRDVFMQYVVPWTKMPKTWISVGCGTARDIEFVTDHIRESKTKVYLCDLSDALLAMAKSRVKMLGLAKQVVFIEGDINATETQKKLPAEADLVTCSYCLTMIPPWKEALKTMKNLVAPGGNLCLIDFTLREGVMDRWDQRLYKWWFAHDGVYFNRAHVDFLESQKDLETVWYSEDEGRVPYTPFKPTHYMYCAEKISDKKKKTNHRVTGRSPSPPPRASRGTSALSATNTKSGSRGKRRSMSPTPRRRSRRI
jgi:ubiquinone/menaquinone biosynthesis C-methylase UbiE